MFKRLIFIALVSVWAFSMQAQKPSRNQELWVVVTKVVDGDTFWGKGDDGNALKIRLIGIDAPEVKASRNKAVGYYGRESAGYLQGLIMGKRVQLVFDVGRTDQYRRTLAYVYLENGTFVNATLIKNGYASVVTYPPNVKHADYFIELQQKARSRKKGMWAKNVF
jgi:micrococcal nuclease